MFGIMPRRNLNIRNALRSRNSRRPRRTSFALLVVSVALLGGGGATIIQAGSHSTFFATLGLAFCQPTFGQHLCHPEYKKHPFIYLCSFIYWLLVFFYIQVTGAHFEFEVKWALRAHYPPRSYLLPHLVCLLWDVGPSSPPTPRAHHAALRLEDEPAPQDPRICGWLALC